jgi:Domain of unknown function (DUF4258)
VVQMEYSQHAKRQMRRRGITEQDVDWALKRPCGNRPGEPGTVWLRGFAAGGRILEVCVRLPERRFITTIAWVDEEGTP